jgi:hypothetical protein
MKEKDSRCHIRQHWAGKDEDLDFVKTVNLDECLYKWT